MPANKTKPEAVPVEDFLSAIPDAKRRQDARALVAVMQEVTGLSPVMWGTSIVGFGTHHYKYESGREGDTAVVSFAPRANALALYGIAAHDTGGSLLAQLGPHEMGKGCLYIKDMAGVDAVILSRMISLAFEAKTS